MFKQHFMILNNQIRQCEWYNMVVISYPSPRVSQLDAHILDLELISLLKLQLTHIFQLHSTSWWTYNLHPELWSLLLNLLVFRLTVWKSGTSYGLSLQNLRLSNFKDGKLIGYSKRSLLLALIVGDYLFNKLQSYLYSTEDNATQTTRSGGVLQSIKRYILTHRSTILSKVNETLKLANLINFILFLVNGKYPSMTHRLLGISMTPIVTDLLKFNGNNVNFEFQNRQLVWNVMTEFLVFILPLLKLRTLRRRVEKILKPKVESSKELENNKITPYTNLPISQCAVCTFNSGSLGQTASVSTASHPVTNPYITNCGHIYCYVCIATKFNGMENSDNDSDVCLRCNEKLTWFKEYNDVDEDAIMVEYEEVEEESSYEDSDEEVEENSNYDLSSEEEEEEGEEEDVPHSANISQSLHTDSDVSDYSEGEDFDEDEAFEL